MKKTIMSNTAARSKRLPGWVTPAIILFGAGAMGAMHSPRPGGNVEWQENYKQAVKKAASLHEPILLSFTTPGCNFCAKMDAETYTNHSTTSLLSRCVSIRLDSDMDASRNLKMGIMNYPTTIVETSSGVQLARFEGYVSSAQLNPVLEEALKVSSRSN